MHYLLLPILGLTVLASSFTAKAEIEGANIVRGKALVVENCSGCHAIGLDDQGNHPSAPAFRDLGDRFPIDALEETFIDTIDTGHPGMPVFAASDQQIADILDYIASVME